MSFYDNISDDQQRQFEAEDIHIWTLSIILSIFKIRYASEAESASIVTSKLGEEIYSARHIKNSQFDVSEILDLSSIKE
jgi:hypothetical protein